MEKDKFKEIIIKEASKGYPNWSLIIETATLAKNNEYPNDASGLYEASGLKEIFDTEKESINVVKDDSFWD